MVLADTTIWIDYFGGARNVQTDWLDQAVGNVELGITDLSLCELLQGVRSDAQFNWLRGEMRRFDVLNTGGEALAIASAENYRLLRTKGFTVRKTIDCLIATYCLIEGHTLLHRDRDFDPFEAHLGLQVVHP